MLPWPAQVLTLSGETSVVRTQEKIEALPSRIMIDDKQQAGDIRATKYPGEIIQLFKRFVGRRGQHKHVRNMIPNTIYYLRMYAGVISTTANGDRPCAPRGCRHPRHRGFYYASS